MKKIILSTIMLMGLAFSTQAQDISDNALGLRLGTNDGFGSEISYQRGLSGNNRIEADLGWRNSNHVGAIKLVGLYQWVWEIQNNFNWYAGVGGGIGSWSEDTKYGDESGSFALLAGDIGIEYNFDEVPIQLSLDYRPEFYLNDTYRKDLGSDIALGIRYRF